MTFKISALSHKKALVLALLGIVTALLISVASFAATSSSSTIIIGAGGAEFGYTVAQTETASVTINDFDSAGITVSSGTNFAVGDHILIQANNGTTSEDDVNPAGTGDFRGFYTITAKDGAVLTLLNDANSTTDPDDDSIATGDIVSEPALYGAGNALIGTTGFVSTGKGAGWTPALNSATSVTPGNYFIVNLKGLTTSDSAFVEIFNTNPNELVKNYTYLNREFGVYVYCASVLLNCSSSPPYATSTSPGRWAEAVDVSGDTINAVGDLLTLTNARVQFNLTGDFVYAITIEGGALYTIDTTTGAGDSLSPDDQITITAR
ncbi:MAG: hypothetical protein IIC29_04950 [Chloroflexi bacterium]|nr:hypothetical protein [Chloroflexota bacterium]